jgi:hypothetical protein
MEDRSPTVRKRATPTNGRALSRIRTVLTIDTAPLVVSILHAVL